MNFVLFIIKVSLLLCLNQIIATRVADAFSRTRSVVLCIVLQAYLYRYGV
jgi:hypothetical protein